MNKLIFLFLTPFGLFSQIENFSGVLKKDNYFENPREYLSQIDSTIIPSDVLIDRVLFDNIILNTNGVNKVTTTEYQDFYKIYQSLKYAHNDTSMFIPFEILNRITEDEYNSNKTYLLGVTDLNFSKIKQEALDQGDFSQGENYLINNNGDNTSFSNHRVVSISPFTHNIFGDDIKFKLEEFFMLSNQKNSTLQNVEIDFGNGDGYRQVSLNEVIEVSYYGESDYIEIKLKLTYLNHINNEIENVYAHHSVYRKTMSNRSNTKSSIQNVKPYIVPPDTSFTYPRKILEQECDYSRVRPACGPVYKYQPYSIDVNILFSESNHSGKLRKPFIMVDGFDPENKRDYWQTKKDKPEYELLPKDRDYRGLYEYLNGELSPWYEDGTVSYLGDALRAEGYDLIFLNFIEGAGDVNKNAWKLRYLIHHLNSSTFRDNKTEEIVMVGPSMGGLITRMALTEMEQSGIEHYVKSWISFDSPQGGAYIPISIQYMFKMMSESDLKSINSQGYEKLRIINTPAAQQMLDMHISSYDKQSSTQHKIDLYSELNRLGYPIFSKRYSITNGGKELLYNLSSNQIISFKATNWAGIVGIDLKGYRMNTDSNIPLKGFVRKTKTKKNNADLVVNNSLPYESAPGGWNSTLYTLNRDEKNKINNDDYLDQFGIRYNKSCFIPTISALGFSATSQNINNTWDDYTNINDFSSGKIRTPFDAIFGMEKNEEHMRISQETKNQVIREWIRPDNTITQRPIVRYGESINQTADDPVAYVVKEEIAFGGNGNTFTFKNGADANVVSGQRIKFLPGFSIKEGAIMSARIEAIENNTILKRSEFKQSDSRNYLKDSPYYKKVHDYSINENAPIDITPLKLSVFPNPASSKVQFVLSGEKSNNVVLAEIYDLNGKLLFTDNIFSDITYAIDISNWAKGLYILKISTNKGVVQSKIVKT